jgi:tetratricopeptide (TPR) repeat protein
LGLWNLAKALARAGNKERAVEVAQLIDKSWRGTQDPVLLQWTEYLIAKGDLQPADATIEQIKAPRERREAFQKLAVAYAGLGNAAESAKRFSQAVQAASEVKGDFDRAQAFAEIVEAQRGVGFDDAARKTLRRLVGIVADSNDSRAKVSALRECATLAARLKDGDLARSQFDQAISHHRTLDESNRFEALQQIASAQASVGLIEDARRTASMIEHSGKEWEWTRDGDREQSLYSIAVAQLNANDADGAVATAMSVKYFVQYRDDALNSVVTFHIAKRDFKSAFATTGKFENPSRKAAAILKVATAQAKAGDRKAAGQTAAQIKLTHRSEMRKRINGHDNSGFDYRRPQTWGESYDQSDFFTMASHQASVERTAAVAAAAMELAQALESTPDQSYAILFKDFNSTEVIQALARTHATCGNTCGNVNDAVAWAKQIGTANKIPEEDKNRVRSAVQQRIHALLGVAEGMIDRDIPQ